MNEVQLRPIEVEEHARAGDLVVAAYRTLGDAGDAFYEPALRDIAGRVETGDVLVAEVGGAVVAASPSLMARPS
jgi:hypothetical protein